MTLVDQALEAHTPVPGVWALPSDGHDVATPAGTLSFLKGCFDLLGQG